MLYMVIENFKNRNAAAVYTRLQEKGRMIPDGLNYIDSWVEPNYEICFQLMETADPALFNEWVDKWNDLVDFEIVPIITSKEAREKVNEK